MNYIVNKVKVLLSSFEVKDFFYIGIIAILILIHIGSCNMNKSITAINLSIPKITPVATYVDKKGETHEVIKEKVYTENQMKIITDSIKHSLKASEVKSVTQAITTVDTTLHTKTFYVDTIDHTIQASYQDTGCYLEFTGNTQTKFGQFKLILVPDTATFIQTFKNHLFKPSTYSIDIHHTNPYFKTTEGMSYTVKENKVLFTIGPVMGIEYNPFTKITSPFVGIGISYNLIGIRKKN